MIKLIKKFFKQKVYVKLVLVVVLEFGNYDFSITTYFKTKS